ncbi:phage head closure protein [Sphingobium phenoxybenzoativorans]|uniref:Phage head closure protein n=1 Tax=Sphingobium phenoxybenzoativorans TaxID=1592790 RepID=A0A975Q0K6_9SPHN|nr:phage head closure protein [Sphingobium phenoxybenzoativorans]
MASNGQGGHSKVWTPLAEIWSEKIPMRGDEVLRDNVLRSTSTARFVIRYRDDVTTKHRLVEKVSGKIWNIRAIDDPYGRSDRNELTCESGVST